MTNVFASSVIWFTSGVISCASLPRISARSSVKSVISDNAPVTPSFAVGDAINVVASPNSSSNTSKFVSTAISKFATASVELSKLLTVSRVFTLEREKPLIVAYRACKYSSNVSTPSRSKLLIKESANTSEPY